MQLLLMQLEQVDARGSSKDEGAGVVASAQGRQGGRGLHPRQAPAHLAEDLRAGA
jgi:hypothetical protein